MIGLDSYSRQVFNYLDPILIYINFWIDCLFEIFKIAVCFLWLSGSLQGHWWGFISRNYVVWPIFFLMNVFIAPKETHFWFSFASSFAALLRNLCYFALYVCTFIYKMALHISIGTAYMYEYFFMWKSLVVWRFGHHSLRIMFLLCIPENQRSYHYESYIYEFLLCMHGLGIRYTHLIICHRITNMF